MSRVQHRKVEMSGADQRLDRWFLKHFPELPRGRLQKLLRTGQVRVDGKRAKAGLRLIVGQEIRIPPITVTATVSKERRREIAEDDTAFVQSLVLHMDRDIIVIDKPAGLAVQGGSATHWHLDGMLDALRFGGDERPRLIHRLDKDTSGVMVLARTAASARRLGKAFAGRDVRKVYWAITVGRPEQDQSRINITLAKKMGKGRERVGVNEDAGKNAITDFQVLERAGNRLNWVALWPRTGRTHQLRAHCVAIGCPILGDGKYGGRDAFIEGLPASAKKLQLHAREIEIPQDGGRDLRIVAPLPSHMWDVWEMLGFEDELPIEPFDVTD
ncbi:MAG: RluA family pseudouridine synthase [Pseudomonadota bacterium]|nr:RluA family pseudouridine synthase [Pseudomonadota bacterium]